MIQFTKWCTSVHPFSLTCNLGLLLLLCLPLSFVKEVKASLTGVRERTLCMLWNQGKCDLENCQYEHLCCVAANGKPCLGNHRAYERKATPH